MKVYFKYSLTGYSGTIDHAVYYYHPRLHRSLMRKYVYPAESESNVRMKSVMANLGLLNPSAGYRQNLRDYLNSYNAMNEHYNTPILTWSNVFLKLMYALKQVYPEVNLSTITRQQIFKQDLPCQSVKRAVEAHLLPVIEGYEWYNELM